jgi:enoyl-CoA hydratase/carnithine racemase
MGREGPFGAFCAGGDIRFFHQAVLAGDPRLEDFFTEEYTLNHLIHAYPKPYVAFMDGIVMGGGMGISAHGGDAACASPPSARRWPCPRPTSACSPTSAAAGSWRAARAASANTWR